jgi:hypothetical protein
MFIVNTFINVMNLAFILGTSFVLSTGFVANCLWVPMISRIKRHEYYENIERNKMGSTLWTREFNQRYPIEEENTLKDKEEFMKNLHKPLNTNFIVTEAIPQGVVYMGHDADGFVYWCDRSVPHSTLDVIARKYCLQSGRQPLYINKDVEEKKEKSPKKKEDDIFVKSKNKNTNMKIKESQLNTRNYYRHKGKLQEYHTTLSNKSKPEKKKMTFEEWQKRRQQEFKKEA